MSAAEIERFVSDLASDELLREKAVNASEGVASLVAIAQEHGYDISVDEARAYIQANTQGELSDDQLDKISGGMITLSGGDPVVAAIVSGSGSSGHVELASVELACAVSAT